MTIFNYIYFLDSVTPQLTACLRIWFKKGNSNLYLNFFFNNVEKQAVNTYYITLYFLGKYTFDP